MSTSDHMAHNKNSQAMNTNIDFFTLFVEMHKLYRIKLPLVSISNLNNFPKVFIKGKQEHKVEKSYSIPASTITL